MHAVSTLGILLVLGGFVLVTATVRVKAFRSSLWEGLFTFFVPFYCWWYGFFKLKAWKVMLAVLACYVVGLGVVGVGGFLQFVRRAKTTEAIETTARIARMSELHREEFASYPPLPAGITAATTHRAGVPRGQKQPADANWSESPWQEMGFQLYDPRRPFKPFGVLTRPLVRRGPSS